MTGIYSPEKILNPNITNLNFCGIERDCVVVEISGSEYNMCEEASKNFWGNSKIGVYGKGLSRTEDDQYKPARTGFLGQIAWGKLSGDPVDLAYRKGGDEQDAIYKQKFKIDIKCATHNYGAGLVYHTNEWGGRIPIDKDIYIFAFVQSEDRKNKNAIIVFVGFAWKEDVERSAVKAGLKGRGHLNHVLPYGDLHPILEIRKV